MCSGARRNVLAPVLTTLRPAPAGTPRRRRRRCIPYVEVLERRDVPSSMSFTPVADNTLYQDPTGSLSNGAGTEMYAGTDNQTSNNIRRAVLRFDVSAIPAGSTIDSATLTLNMSKTASAAGAEIMNLHRLTSSWGEGTSDAAGGVHAGQGAGAPATTNDATWLYRFYNTQQWTTPGGDFSTTVSAAATVNGVGSYSWSAAGMVSDVHQWVNNSATNFGWILIGAESTGGTAKQFDTRENVAANRPTLVVQFTAPPDLTIRMTHAGNFVQGDAADAYTIQVGNSGGSATSGAVTVTDTLPSGLAPTAADNGTIAGWTVSFSGQTITARRSDALAAGSSYANLTVTAAVAANAPASVTNTATVAGGGETNTSNDSASDPTTIATPPNLAITKTHTGNFTQGDSADTYTIAVKNQGGSPTTAAVTVTDVLPTGLAPTVADKGTIAGWAVSFSGQTITAARSDALAGGSGYPNLTLTVAVADNAPANVTNTATVTGGSATEPSNASASDLTTINPVADLTVAVSHTGTFTEGDAADTYTVTVSNVGLGATNGTVTVSDPLPAGLTPTGADNGTIAGWTMSFSGQTITATRSDVLASGGSYANLTLTVVVADNAPASITNTVTVAGGGELNTGNDSASDTTPVSLLPDLTILKSHTGNFVQGDAADSYTITVNNGGGAATTAAVTVTDTLPTGLAPTPADSGTIAGWTVSASGQTITASRSDSLAAGTSYPDLPITVAVAADAPSQVTNTATVAGGGETDTSDDSASDTTTVVPLADVTVSMNVPASVVAGVPFTVTVTAHDRSDAPLTGFAGTVQLIGTDPHAPPPATLPLSGGVGSFTMTLKTAGNQSLVATVANVPGFAVLATVQVVPAAAALLVFAQQPTATLAAAPFLPTVRVTALDAFRNVAATDNSDVVTIGLRKRPAGTILSGTTSATLVGGVAVFPTLQLNQPAIGVTLIATSPTLPAVQSSPFDVAPVARFTVTTTQTTLTANTGFIVTVTAVDSTGHLVSNYGGTIHFHSADAQAVLPADTTLIKGQRTFTVIPRTAGAFSVSVSDLAKPSVVGTLARSVIVTPAAVQALAITGANATIVAGTAQSVTVSAVDAFGNVNTSYRGSVILSSTDLAAHLPATHTFVAADAGKFAFALTLNTPGLRAITASDQTLSVTQPNILVVGTSVALLTEPDPQNAANTALVVVGTAGNDVIDIVPASADGTQATVLVKGVAQGTFAPTGHIFVYGVAGTDAIHVRTGTGTLAGVQVAVPAVIIASTGNVTVDATGSAANNILVGGPGHDTLTAGTGNDILIGGAGTSVLHAGAGSDLLVGGATMSDANILALMQLMREWGNASITYLTRVAHLSGTLSGGVNAPTAFLNRTTAHSGTAVSALIGGSGVDWFLGSNTDVVANLVDGEVFTQI